MERGKQKDLTWDEFLKRSDLIGKDVELSGMETRGWRGPISQMKDCGDHVKFTCKWVARRLKTERAWRKRGFTTFTLHKSGLPPCEYDTRPGEVVIYGACCSWTFGMDNLDPTAVRGLQLPVAA